VQRRHLLSLAVLSLAMSLGGILLVRNRAGEPSATAPEATVSDSGLSGVALAPPNEDMKAAPPIGTDQRVPESPSEKSADVQLDPTRRVLGSVVFPDDTPLDEHAEVVLEYLPPSTDDSPAFAREMWGKWEEAARAQIAADGSFALALPRESDAVRVDISADYLYLERPQKIEDRETPGAIELVPRIGARVTFVLVPPAHAERDSRQLVGRTIKLAYTPRNMGFSGSAPTVSLTVTSDLTLEGRGLAVDQNYSFQRRAMTSEEGEDLSPFLVDDTWDPFLTAGVHSRIDVPLLEGVSVSGTVRSESGEAVEGARVQVAATFDNGGSYWYDDTDENGRFSLEAIHPGLTGIRAEKDGFKPAIIESTALGEGLERTGFELVLTRGMSIAGTLRLPEGNPVSNARLVIQSGLGGQFVERFFAFTDANGDFELSGLDEGEFTVSTEVLIAEAPTNSASAVDALDQPASEGAAGEPLRYFAKRNQISAGALGLELALEPPAVVSGRILDLHGAPVPTFMLMAAPLDDSRPSMPGMDPMAFVDRSERFESPEGHFEWAALPSGKWYVEAASEGYPNSKPQLIDIPSLKAPLEFVLAPGATLSGVVLDEGGTPLPEVNVEITRVASLNRSMVGVQPTDPQGGFQRAGLDPGRYEITARTEELVCVDPLVVGLSAGEDRTDLQLRLVRSGQLVCEVFGRDGIPAAGALVWSKTIVSADWGDRFTTDGGGQVEVGPLPPGDVILNVSIDNEDSSTEERFSARARVVSGQRVRVRIGAGAKSSLTVAGRLTGRGVPLSGAAIDAYSSNGAHAGATIQKDGQFTLGLPEGGRVSFVVSPSSGGSGPSFVRDLPMEGQAEVLLDLPTSGLRGRVLLPPDDGASFAVDATLIARKGVEGQRGSTWAAVPGETWRSSSVEDDGTFAFYNLEPGTYDLLVGRTGRSAEVFGPSPVGVAQRLGLRIGPGEMLDGIVLEPAAAGRIEGRVLDSEGHSIEGARINARLPSGAPCAAEAVFSKEDGGFLAGGLPIGEIQLVAAAPHLASASPSVVEVRSDESMRIELVLVPATMLHLSLPDDIPEEGLSLEVTDWNGFDRTLDAADDGDGPQGPRSRTFGPLPPGNYTIELFQGATSAFKTTVSLAGEPDREVRLAP
jgi:protocatechuate 3,4-dioxygenase beta subunit